MATVGSIIVRIGANTDDLLKGVNRAEGALAKVGRTALNIGATIAKAFGAAVIAVGALAIKGIALGNELARTARIVGLTTAELGAMHHAAALSEVSAEQLDKGLQRLGRTVSQADNGLKSAVASLGQLGLKAGDIEKLPLSEQFIKVSEAMKGMTNQGDKLRIATELFGKSGAELIPLLDEGADSIRRMMEESRALGLQLDETQSRVVQEASDSFDRMKGSVQGLSMQLGAALGPAIKIAVEAIVSITSAITRWLPKGQAMLSLLLRIRSAADDMSDIALSTELSAITLRTIELNSELVKTATRLNAMGPHNEHRARTESRVNQILAEQVDLEKRRAELEESAAQRMRDRADPVKPVGTVDDDESNVDERAKAAEKLTQQFLTDVERQKAAWLEAQALFNEGLISAETVQRMQDSLLQPIQVTTDFLRDTNQQRLADLLASFQSEAEVEQERYMQRLTDLQELYANELLALDEFNRQKELLTKEHQTRLTDIETAGMTDRQKFEAMTLKQKTTTLFGELAAITSGVAQHDKKMFKLNKLAAIGNAVISTAEGIAKAWSYGPILGPIFAGIVAAAGFAQIKAIKSTQFGGGGTGTTPSAVATPVVNDQPVGGGAGSGGGRNQTITIQGIDPSSLFNGRQMREFLERLQDALKDGGRLVIA